MKRSALIFLYLGTIATLGVCIFYFGWGRTFSAIFVPPLSPRFADMRFIQGAVISAKQGLDPYILNPNDVWGRLLNYPPIWLKFGQAINLPDESRFIQFSILMVLCFVGSCAYTLYRFPSFGVLVCLLSTATLMGIERGNTDLIIYPLVFAFALVIPKKLSPVPILVATALKLYPVFALVVLLIKRQFRLFFLSLIIASAVFAGLWNELAAIRSNTPMTFNSYGLPTLAANTAFFLSLNLPSWVFLGCWAAVICSTIFVTALYLTKMEGILRNEGGLGFNLFVVGASIYVGTFIFSSNHDYRLMFLIMCVPFIETKRFPLSVLLVFLIILAMNQLVLIHLGGIGIAINWFAKIAIFIVLSAYLVILVLAVFERRDDASKVPVVTKGLF
jgi:hypothetical protein